MIETTCLLPYQLLILFAACLFFFSTGKRCRFSHAFSCCDFFSSSYVIPKKKKKNPICYWSPFLSTNCQTSNEGKIHNQFHTCVFVREASCVNHVSIVIFHRLHLTCVALHCCVRGPLNYAHYAIYIQIFFLIAIFVSL